MKKEYSIGVFDSGIGGISVLKKLFDKLPGESYIYLGDTKRVPYGDRTQEEILGYTREILDWYKSQNVKIVISACNTTCANALEMVKDEYDFPVLGIIRPVVNYINKSDIKKIGVLSTSATARSKAYSTLIRYFDSSKEVFEIGCPGLVEIVEKRKNNAEQCENLLNIYVNFLLDKNVEQIILGCTHYSFLKQEILKVINKSIKLIDPADFVVDNVIESLEKLEILNDLDNGSINYYVTKDSSEFIKTISSLISEYTRVEEIKLMKFKAPF